MQVVKKAFRFIIPSTVLSGTAGAPDAGRACRNPVIVPAARSRAGSAARDRPAIMTV